MAIRTNDKLYARINGELTEAPAGAVAYKYADPVEDARWVMTLDDRKEIESEDPSLIEELSVMGHCTGCGDDVLLSEAEWIGGTCFCDGCAGAEGE